ncbi:hypothetical protein IW261DRAFT_1594949 [Armillaria novae-zelandiae]|uniref:Uncharacterized protein n=1 Tax=Armillaria novae-zelandiae TaxID=153914 RepID=A0AA39U8F0_9AGAR|nr:hypothetical protein IW261DRAFT_1594949 [Armillaria novae-zelandiae]
MTAERSNKESQEQYDDESSETSYEDTEDSTDLTSAQSSYVPLDAHILASWRHPNSVVLPFVCVTDGEDIFSLMGGVLYQRSTWGISEPVIGIILSKTGFVGRVVLGWLDKECHDPEVLPTIRFAYGDETHTDASLGVYDLTDPVSAVKFSQFILSLRAHVEGIVARCHTPTFKRILWRSDSIDEDNSGAEEQWEQGIINWLNTVAKCGAPFESSSSYSCASDIDLVYPQELSLGAACKKNSSAQSVERGRQELGAKSLAGIGPDAKLSFSSYAHERHITGLTNVQFEVNAQELKVSKDMTPSEIDELENVAAEINEMLGFYDEMTQYMKPPTAEQGLPAIDKRVEAVREHFRSQVDSSPASENTRELPQESWEIISSSLSSLLWASVGEYSKNQGGKDCNEAEARHEWDVLLNVGFERALSLSRNVAADLAQTSIEFDGQPFRTVAVQAYQISLQVHQAINRHPESSFFHKDRLVLQALQVATAAYSNKMQASGLFKQLEEAKAATLKRSGDEPELGIVDAILTIPLDNFRNTSEPLIHVTETRQTVDAARTLNPDNISEPDTDKISVDNPNSNDEQEAASQAPPVVEVKKLDGAVENYMHPFAVSCSETKLAPGITYPTGMVMDITALVAKLLLAVLVVEYKKRTQTYAKALVQAKMYLEASVRFLASLGVTKQAVFALATDGVHGAVLMGWCSSDSERVYIVERNVRTFDISQPIEVYHFVTVLLRLRKYDDTTLKDAVESALKAKDFKPRTWSKTAQFDRME